MEKSILIIGGTGCISSAIVSECLKSGIKTTIINRGRRRSLIPDGVELIKADKSDFNTINTKLKNRKFTAIVDFLCYTVPQIKKSIENYAFRTDQYIFISSCAVCDFRKTKIGDEESPKVDERWDYSVQKWKAEEYLRSQASTKNFTYTIIRPSITYGDTRIPYGITPPYGQHGTIIQRILHGKPIIRWNEGINLCNMMRVEDFARAFVKLIGNPASYNEEFNICSEEAHSFNEVLDILSKKIGKDIIKIDLTPEQYGKALPKRKGEIIAGRSMDCVSSLKKFKSLFPDFKEEYTLSEGISKTIDAYLSQNWMDGMNWEFDAVTDYIILHHLDKNNKNKEKYHLRFIDYLNHDNIKDKQAYMRSYNSQKWYNRRINSIKCTLYYVYSRTIRRIIKGEKV